MKRRLMLRSWCALLALAWGACFGVLQLPAQDPRGHNADQNRANAAGDRDQGQPAVPIHIQSEPQVIDPVQVLPKAVTVKATADFSDSSLRELVRWLEKEHGLVVLLDKPSFSKAQLSPAEPISDRLANEPIYLLLNRLRAIRLRWWYDDDVLHLGVRGDGVNLITKAHDIVNLLEAGYSGTRLAQAIQTCIAPNSWADAEGNGTLSFLGDVMFVRQSPEVHYQIQALIVALEEPAERTFIWEPTENLAIRQKLVQPLTVKLEEAPFVEAIEQLAELSGVDIRLDRLALARSSLRERQPVSLSISERKLSVVLDALLGEVGLRWILRDGVLWVTTPGVADTNLKTAVYDVRDLCISDEECTALTQALYSQTSDQFWSERDGHGEISFPRTGVMVIYATDPAHDSVLRLLRAYRKALTAAKQRRRTARPEEIVTVFYRVPEVCVKDLLLQIPARIRPGTWKKKDRPDAVGEMIRVASKPELLVDDETGEHAGAVPYATLIVTHYSSVQEEVQDFIDRVLEGDEPQGIGGFGGGGGGFGGGVLRYREAPLKRPNR